MEVATTDYHTAGEPFRIVTSGAPDISGATVRERRSFAQRSEAVDAVRRLLCHEPRGHADMYGCFTVPPDDDGADFGVLFWHKDGYSTACGHGTIALGAWAVESGRVEAAPDGETEITIDVPSGRVTARVRCSGGAVESVVFRNVPAFAVARGVEAGGARADVAYGGAIYASVAAADLGLTVTPDRVAELIAAGRALAWIERGEVLFKAEIGAVSRAACQVQGVWVAPAHRGRGIGTAGTAAVVEYARTCIAPVVSLYVNDFNTSARAAYRRVGFREVGRYASVLF